VPLLVDKIKTNLDFHIFDVLDLDLLLGSPVEKLLDASRGSLDEKLREAASSTTPLFSKILWRSLFPSKTHSRSVLIQNPLLHEFCGLAHARHTFLG
jgi:hypothetical protein